MSNDKTAEEIETIIDKFWNNLPEDERKYSSVLISEVAKSYSAQQLKEYRENLKKKLNNFSKDKHGRIFTTEVIELIDQTDSTK